DVSWYLAVRRRLFAIVSADGNYAMLKDGEEQSLLLVFSSVPQANLVGRLLGENLAVRQLPADPASRLTEIIATGASGIVVDYNPGQADGTLREPWRSELSA